MYTKANDIAQIVAKHTEFTHEQLKSANKSAELVNARILLIHVLKSRGYYVSQIARVLNRTKSAIQAVIHDTGERIESNKILSIILQDIERELSSNRV